MALIPRSTCEQNGLFNQITLSHRVLVNSGEVLKNTLSPILEVAALATEYAVHHFYI